MACTTCAERREWLLAQIALGGSRAHALQRQLAVLLRFESADAEHPYLTTDPVADEPPPEEGGQS